MTATDVAALVDHIAHFQHRVLQDAVAEQLASQHRRRAAAFEAAAPRDCDFRGRATDADLDAAWRRCLTISQALRSAATLALVQDGDPAPNLVWCGICGTPTSPWTCSCGETRVGGVA